MPADKELGKLGKKLFRSASGPVRGAVSDADERWNRRGAEIASNIPDDTLVGRFGRFAVEVAIGKRRNPFPRGRVNQDRMAAESYTERFDSAQRRVNNLYNNNLRHGMAAAKRAVIELGGTEGDVVAEAAIHFLIGSSSWSDMHSNTISTGPNAGKRISQIREWQLAPQNRRNPNSQALYAEISRYRPDWKPDVINRAENTHPQHTYEGTPGDAAHAHIINELNRRCIEDVINRFKNDNVKDLDIGFFEDIDQLANPALSSLLGQALSYIKHNTGPQGQNAVGNLGSLSNILAIDAALSHGPHGYTFATL